MRWISFGLATLAMVACPLGGARAQGTRPAVDLRVGVLQGSTINYPAQLPLDTAPFAFDVVPGSAGPTEGSWHVLLARASIQDVANPGSSEETRLIAGLEWRAKFRHADLTLAFAFPGSHFQHPERIHLPHFNELAGRPLHIEPRHVNDVVGWATDAGGNPPDENAVKAYAQPFLYGTPHRFWRSHCAHWDDSQISPGGYSNNLWNPTHYREIAPGGEHLLNIGIIAEMAFQRQAPSIEVAKAFLQGPDYADALGQGMIYVDLQVMTLISRHGGLPNLLGPGQTPSTAPGLPGLAGGPLPGFSLSDPITIQVPSSGYNGGGGGENPPSAPFYPVGPAIVFAVGRGEMIEVAIGPAANVDTALFTSANGTVSLASTMVYTYDGSGTAYVSVPMEAMPGEVAFVKMNPPPPHPSAIVPAPAYWTPPPE